jgi:hypothetical protein
MDKKTVYLSIGILLIAFVVLLFHKEILGHFRNMETNTSLLQPFQNMESEGPKGLIYDTPEVAYEYNKQDANDFPETIWEKSLKTEFAQFPVMLCNALPTLRESQCMINNEPIVKYKFPVHLLKISNGKHVAVFNDGRLYMKDKMTDKMWQGPLKNSLPNRSIPLRMVTLDPSGTKLVGVGYDNKAYIKYGDPNLSIDLEGDWRELYGLENIIYLMYFYDASIDKNRYIVIDTTGKIKATKTDNPNSGLVEFGVLNEPILKLILSADGYMLALDTKFQLRTFEDKEWSQSQFSTKFGANPNKVSDVIYDRDQLLFGCVFLPKAGIIEVMKQEEPDYQAKFVPFELNRFLTGGMESVLTDRTIIMTKLGIFTGQGLLEEEALDDDINMAYQRQMLLDKQRLREFCKARGLLTENNQRDYSVLRKVEDNKIKIDKLNDIITKLISFDPDQKPIQESVLGVNFIEEQLRKRENNAVATTPIAST